MVEWRQAGTFEDIRYETSEGIAKLTINRPEVRNAFRPTTLFELSTGFDLARDDPSVGAIVLTGQGPDAWPTAGATSRSWKRQVGSPSVSVAHCGAPSQPWLWEKPGRQVSLFGEAMYLPQASWCMSSTT